MATWKYALRYIPLLLLALILVPWRLASMNVNPTASNDRSTAQPPDQTIPSPYRAGSTLYAVAARSAQESWAVGGTFTTERIKQGDTYWQSVQPTAGIILHYAEKYWRQETRTPQPLFGVAFSSDQDGWAVGYGGALVHYDGQSWNTIAGPTSINANLYGIALPSATDGWAVGQGGVILHYDGQQWTQVKSPTDQTLHSVAMASESEGWAVGDHGTIVHYHEGAWSAVQVQSTNALNDVVVLSADEAWAVGANSTILHYRAGNWLQICTNHCGGNYYAGSLDPTANLTGIAMTGVQSGWITYEDTYQHGFWTYLGEVWSVPDTSVFSEGYRDYGGLVLRDIAMVAPDMGWAVGSLEDEAGRASVAIFLYQQGQWNQA